MSAALAGTIYSAAACSAAFAQGGSIELKLDTRVLELGEAINVELVCTNTEHPSAPRMQVADGLSLELVNAQPFASNFTQIINGRRSDRLTYTFRMRLTAKKVGTFALGPVTVVADGQTYSTDPVQIVVRDTQDTEIARGDRLVFVAIAVDRQSLYVTESLTATLTIGVRKVEVGGRVYDMDLLRQVVDLQGSQFSVFVGANAQKMERALLDSDGVRHQYEVFRVVKLLRAEEVGTLRVGPVFVKGNYPTAIRRGFFGGYEVSQAQRVIARADAIDVDVLSPPEQGRPPSFKGAIGQYTIAVDAKPTRVEQGQPITLTVTIQGAPIEGIAGPDLTLQPELASRFDFTGEELIGDQQGNAKVFRRAIFPKQSGEQTIPRITWSYFDPKREQYVVLESDPVDVTVDPSSTTGMALVPLGSTEMNGARSGASRPSAGTTLTVLTGGISPNVDDPSRGLTDQSFRLTLPWAAALVVSPVAWLALTLAMRHRRRLRSDVAFARRHRARRTAQERIRAALRNGDPSEQVDSLADALSGYISDRFAVSTESLTTAEARSILQERGVNGALSTEIVGFLECRDAVRYAPRAAESVSPARAADDVRRWIARLEGVAR